MVNRGLEHGILLCLVFSNRRIERYLMFFQWRSSEERTVMLMALQFVIRSHHTVLVCPGITPSNNSLL